VFLELALAGSKTARKRLAFAPAFSPSLRMPLPSQPVTLTVEQVAELNRKLSNLRHDINNQLSLIMAAVELIHHKPQTSERMMATLAEQPPRIAAALAKFSGEFEQAFGIARP
jgi:hypothetical protein